MINPKKNKKRKASSRAWIERQLNDPYVKKAQALGYKARSAFKLIEIDEKYNLLKDCSLIVDLGCAPGSWLQVIQERTKNCDIIGCDLIEIEPMSNVHFIHDDFTSLSALNRFNQYIDGRKCSAVVSDMAANTTGHGNTDAIRTQFLAELALDFACDNLAIGGFFLCKFFQGGAHDAIIKPLQQRFAKIHHIKPKSSRSHWPEIYGLAIGFRG